jgi:hypothetical protein
MQRYLCGQVFNGFRLALRVILRSYELFNASGGQKLDARG